MAMDAASAMGSIALWGFSPAIDFTVESSNPGAFEFWNKKTCDAVNVLFVGLPDLSHILQNLPEALRRTDRPVNFYVLENSVEVYARQLLLLWLLCEPPDSVGLQDKVWMFLEIVGNTLVRPSTACYVAETATKLIELVTGGDDGAVTLPLVSLAELRHRERDQLAAVFQFWRTPDAAVDVAHMWDLRLRQQLAQRYDARLGIFDWDYFMRLKDRLDVEFVQPAEYKHWRETGVAVRRPGTEQTCVNLTLVTTRVLGRPGERQLRRGYWGDIVSGPYAAFGLRSDDPSLSRKQNGRLAATAATVSAANLEALFSSVASSLPGATHVRVRLLPADGGAALGRRAAYRQRFEAAVFSSGMSHLLTPPVVAGLRDGAAVVLETTRYIVCVAAEQQRRLLERYDELADTAGCRPFGEEPCGEKPGLLSGKETTMMEGGGQRVVEGQQTHELREECEEGQSRLTEAGEDGSQSEEKRGSVVADFDIEAKSVEVVPAKISKPQEIVPNDELQKRALAGATEESKPAPATEITEVDDKHIRDSVQRETNSVKSAEDTNVGDTARAVRGDEDKDSVLPSSVDRSKLAGTIENGAGEPKVAGVVLGNCDKDTTSTAEGQSEKAQCGPDPAAVTIKTDSALEDTKASQEAVGGKNGTASENSDRQRLAGCSNLASEAKASSDDVDSSGTNATGAPSAETGKSSSAELAGTRRWASDKLTSLPEWVCFVKRRADGVIAEPLSW